jgi:hypothetical protein
LAEVVFLGEKQVLFILELCCPLEVVGPYLQISLVLHVDCDLELVGVLVVVELLEALVVDFDFGCWLSLLFGL